MSDATPAESLEDHAYFAAIQEIAALMPTDAEWDLMTVASPPPQSWHDEEDGLDEADEPTSPPLLPIPAPEPRP